MSDRIKLADFIEQNGITMDVTQVFENPHMEDACPGSFHYQCRLKRGKVAITVPFTMGPGHVTKARLGMSSRPIPPKAEDVLNCMASDASGYENAQSFEDWCGEYGYDEDSRKAKRTWKAVERQTAKLRKLLDSDQFDTLLWNTERL